MGGDHGQGQFRIICVFIITDVNEINSIHIWLKLYTYTVIKIHMIFFNNPLRLLWITEWNIWRIKKTNFSME